MAEKYLVIVDVQNDFVTGALSTNEARAIVENVMRKAKNFSGGIVFTQDTHDEDYLNTQEGKLLPVPHCVKGTEGWRLIPELEALQKARSELVFEKPSFGSLELPLSVDSSCCAGVSPEKHKAALLAMASCQILIKNDMYAKDSTYIRNSSRRCKKVQ